MEFHSFFTIVLAGALALACFIVIWTLYRVNYFEKHIIENEKARLEAFGFKLNNSYRITHKKTGVVQYIRVYKISIVSGKAFASAYMTTKKGEIGLWFDNVIYLYDIFKNYNLEDIGEWMETATEKINRIDK